MLVSVLSIMAGKEAEATTADEDADGVRGRERENPLLRNDEALTNRFPNILGFFFRDFSSQSLSGSKCDEVGGTFERLPC